MLLEPDTLEVVDKFLGITTVIGAVPIESRLPKHRRFAISKSFVFTIKYIINTCLTSFTLLALFAITYISWQMERAGIVPYPFVVFWGFFSLLQLLFVYGDYLLWKIGEEIVYLANSVLAWTHELNELYEDELTDLEKKLDAKFERQVRQTLKGLYTFILTTTIAFSFICPIIYWNEAIALINILLTPFEMAYQIFVGTDLPLWMSIVITFIGYIFYLYEATCIMHRFISVASLIYVFVQFFQHIFKLKLRYKAHDDDDSPDSYFGHPRKAAQAYRILFLVINYSFVLLSNFLAIGEGIAITLCSFLLYFALGYQGPILERVFEFIGFLFVAISSSYAFDICGKFNVLSVNVLDSWRNGYCGSHQGKGRRRRYERGLFKAMRPLKVYAGSAYFLDQRTMLRMWDTIIDKTIFLLCGFPFGK